MFNFFKKKNKGLEVDAVVDGTVMPITDVNDDVFSTKMFMHQLLVLFQRFSQPNTPLALRLTRDWKF